MKNEVLCFVNYILVKIFGVFSRYFFPYLRIGSGFSTGSQVDQKNCWNTYVYMMSQSSFPVVRLRNYI